MIQQNLFTEVEEEELIIGEDTKKCIRCNKVKLKEAFPKHIQHKDRLDSRCRLCIKEGGAFLYQLRKTAPPKPEKCECCNKKHKKTLVLDHDHVTKKFRGWLCDPCNLAIGGLGDNLKGILRGAIYLENNMDKIKETLDEVFNEMFADMNE